MYRLPVQRSTSGGSPGRCPRPTPRQDNHSGQPAPHTISGTADLTIPGARAAWIKSTGWHPANSRNCPISKSRLTQISATQIHKYTNIFRRELEKSADFMHNLSKLCHARHVRKNKEGQLSIVKM